MFVDQATQQFMYKAFITLFCGVIAIMFAFMCVVGIMQGDGEAVRIIDALQPIAFGAFASLAGVLGIHSVTSASVAKATVNATSSPSDPAPAADPQPAAIAAIAAAGVQGL